MLRWRELFSLRMPSINAVLPQPAGPASISGAPDLIKLEPQYDKAQVSGVGTKTW